MGRPVVFSTTIHMRSSFCLLSEQGLRRRILLGVRPATIEMHMWGSEGI